MFQHETGVGGVPHDVVMPAAAPGPIVGAQRAVMIAEYHVVDVVETDLVADAATRNVDGVAVLHRCAGVMQLVVRNPVVAGMQERENILPRHLLGTVSEPTGLVISDGAAVLAIVRHGEERRAYPEYGEAGVGHVVNEIVGDLVFPRSATP